MLVLAPNYLSMTLIRVCVIWGVTDQAKATKGKDVVVFNELRNRMIKPHKPEIGVWKENVL
jgi:hypothetical protein